MARLEWAAWKTKELTVLCFSYLVIILKNDRSLFYTSAYGSLLTRLLLYLLEKTVVMTITSFVVLLHDP